MGLGSGVWGWSLGFRVWVLGFEVWGLRSGVWGLGVGVPKESNHTVGEMHRSTSARSACAWRITRSNASQLSLPKRNSSILFHPGGTPGGKSLVNLPLFESTFVWERTKETIVLPQGCLQGGWEMHRSTSERSACAWRITRSNASGPINPLVYACQGNRHVIIHVETKSFVINQLEYACQGKSLFTPKTPLA